MWKGICKQKEEVILCIAEVFITSQQSIIFSRLVEHAGFSYLLYHSHLVNKDKIQKIIYFWLVTVSFFGHEKYELSYTFLFHSGLILKFIFCILFVYVVLPFWNTFPLAFGYSQPTCLFKIELKICFPISYIIVNSKRMNFSFKNRNKARIHTFVTCI